MRLFTCWSNDEFKLSPIVPLVKFPGGACPSPAGRNQRLKHYFDR